MPILYLAKVNLNSNIFEVYDEKLNIRDVCDVVYQSISDEADFFQSNLEKYIDSYGSKQVYMRNSKYVFREITKEKDGVVTGKLVRTFNKPTEKLDETTQKMVGSQTEENVSIYFYYDVYKEMITFCERQSFGYNQFMNAFMHILNKSVKQYQFEIYLQKDKDILEKKIRELKVVQRVKAILIPPNSNDEDLQSLRELAYMQDCKTTNATKLKLEYVSDAMAMESKVMKDIVKAVSRGYGDVTATGINNNGRMETVSSSQHAAYTICIQDNLNKEEYNEESRNFILRYMMKLTNKFIV